MLDAADMGIRPEVFLAQMAEEEVQHITNPEKQQEQYQRVLARLQRDWNRRFGPNGWLRKVVRLETKEDLAHQMIHTTRQVRQLAMRMVRDISLSPRQRLWAMQRVYEGIRLECQVLGLEPPQLPVPKQSGASKRELGDVLYEFLKGLENHEELIAQYLENADSDPQLDDLEKILTQR